MANDEDYIYLTTDFDWMIEHNRDFLNLPNTEGFAEVNYVSERMGAATTRSFLYRVMTREYFVWTWTPPLN